MARLKDRGIIAKRDPNFARRLEITAELHDTSRPAAPVTSQKPSTADPNPASTGAKKPERLVPTPAPTEKPAKIEPAVTPMEQTKPVAEATSEAQREAVAPVPGAAIASQKKRAGGKHAERKKIRVTFRMPTDLVSRAEVWATKARCPVGAVIRKGFKELRPVLIEQIERGIRYTEIPHERISDASYNFDTTMMVSAEAYDKLAAEIDPEDMTGLEAPMSRWTRVKFIESLDRYLTQKGY
ncbi:hypothetical protein [Paracoccus sp. MKU1]|uniref:hypothetical protein n=1 Tax=Paracoccus sp. MKU1 TaxID=1745182 RepID=UPI000A85579C|nr:hypothetical protein [Paracoccus sp. MKU1]